MVIKILDSNFINAAKIEAIKSKDPSTKIGCVIVNQYSVIIGRGYNSWPKNVDEKFMTYERPMKYSLIIHAEMKALLSAYGEILQDSSMYCTHSPCDNCLKHIFESGISRIIFDQLGPTSVRGTDIEKKAIVRLLKSRSDIECTDINGKLYLDYFIK